MYYYYFAFIFLMLNSCGSAHNNNPEKVGDVPGEKGITTLKSENSNTYAVAFIYHRIGDPRYPSTNTTTAEFESHVRYLKENDFLVMTYEKAVEALKDGSYPNTKIAVITVDDAFLSFYENGYPILKKYGLPATLFINTETVSGNSYMNWDQIKELQKEGFEIGNHSHSHSYFLNNDEQDRHQTFEDDVNKAQEIFEEQLGFSPNVFAYPYGEYDLKMKELVEKMGFTSAAAQNSGVMYEGSDLYAMPRFPMSTSYAAIDRFKEKANMLPVKVLSVSPENLVIDSGNKRPLLKIAFDKTGLRTKQLQCFIQGSKCDFSMHERDGQSIATLKPTTDLVNRRTLYTITVPDDDGRWHWFSYLWIKPSIN